MFKGTSRSETGLKLDSRGLPTSEDAVEGGWPEEPVGHRRIHTTSSITRFKQDLPGLQPLPETAWAAAPPRDGDCPVWAPPHLPCISVPVLGHIRSLGDRLSENLLKPHLRVAVDFTTTTSRWLPWAPPGPQDWPASRCLSPYTHCGPATAPGAECRSKPAGKAPGSKGFDGGGGSNQGSR